MTVYPEKTGRGYTGVWIVERTRNGIRARDRFNSFEEAEAFENGTDFAEPRAKQYTLGDLYREGNAKLWPGRKSELQSGRNLLAAVKRIGFNRPATEVDYTTLEDLVEELRADNLSNKTCNRYLAAVSKLLKWGVKAKKIPLAPPVPWQRESKGRQAWLPEELTEPFLRTLAETSGPSQAFAAEVLVLTGMRVSELLTLAPNEVVGDVIELHKTKTDAPRSLPVPHGYGDLLRVFCMVDRSNQYHYRKLNRACTRASEILGLMPKITPHVLRHSVATRLTKQGVPTVTVARIMGHKSLKTTEGYVHHEVSTLRAAMVTLMSGTRGAIAISSNSRANLEALENTRFSGGLGGNRTPVQGFAVDQRSSRKPQK